MFNIQLSQLLPVAPCANVNSLNVMLQSLNEAYCDKDINNKK